ncbi:flippase-like domain-containing protein [Candidatus Parcubacteria bacterium]|nr:flippase-like domain-containing protein [Candidatus Parcubacteria bacterium]
MQKEKITSFIKRFRQFLGFFILGLTIAVFWLYFKNNPGALTPLKDIGLFIIVLLVAFYFLFLITNFFITSLTIKLCGKNYPNKDTLQLTAYSTLVNFFGPLQSGPGFRAVFLKAKLGIKIKDYTLATIVYYFFFALISLLMMFGPVNPLLALAVTLGAIVIGYRYLGTKRLINKKSLIIGIFLATIIQLLLVAVIYGVELKALGAHASISSILIYTGSANLALFVAFTPGAIGIRESFIYFSQSLHHVPTDVILAAGLLDRAVYVVFLGLLFVASGWLHFGKKFDVKQSRPIS